MTKTLSADEQLQLVREIHASERTAWSWIDRSAMRTDSFLEAKRRSDPDCIEILRAVKSADSIVASSVMKEIRRSRALREHLIVMNMPLASIIARRHIISNGVTGDDDIKQETMLALNDAIGRFDFTKKVKFMSYATFHIRKRMFDYRIDKDSAVRVPRYQAWNDGKLQLPSFASLDEPVRNKNGDKSSKTGLDALKSCETPYHRLEGIDAAKKIKSALASFTPLETVIALWRLGIDGKRTRSTKKMMKLTSMKEGEMLALADELVVRLEKLACG